MSERFGKSLLRKTVDPSRLSEEWEVAEGEEGYSLELACSSDSRCDVYFRLTVELDAKLRVEDIDYFAYAACGGRPQPVSLYTQEERQIRDIVREILAPKGAAVPMDGLHKLICERQRPYQPPTVE